MKWILTQRNVLINVDTIGYMKVEKKRRLKPIKTDAEFNHIEEIKYAVVAELNYQDEDCDYIYLTNDFDDKEKADDVFGQVIVFLTGLYSGNLLNMNALVDALVNESQEEK